MARKKDMIDPQLEEIKNLIVLMLIRDGASAEELGKVLKLTSRRIQQLFPMKLIKQHKSK